MIFSDGRRPARLRAAALAALAVVFAASAPGAQTVIKFATLAPEGSTWMKVMNQFNAELAEKTGGRVKFKIYAGGVMGDEKDVVRKIRLGQLHSGGFTGVGIGEIAPEVRILDTPFLFKSKEEIDHVCKTFSGDFKKAFADKGYVLLGWAEVGDVNIFSNSPVTRPGDLKAVKMWIWEGDPIAEATFSALKIKPIPLSITDVMTSLQTGMINSVYGSPMAVIALQWFTKMKYVFSLPLANASGAVLLSKKTFDRLSGEDQKTLLELGERHLKNLTARSRQDNEKSVAVLKNKSLVFTGALPADEAAFEKMGQEARRGLVGKLYTQAQLDRMEKALRELRAKKSGSGKS